MPIYGKKHHLQKHKWFSFAFNGQLAKETIMQFGVFVLPGLVVDGKVVTAGYRGLLQLAKVLEAL